MSSENPEEADLIHLEMLTWISQNSVHGAKEQSLMVVNKVEKSDILDVAKLSVPVPHKLIRESELWTIDKVHSYASIISLTLVKGVLCDLDLLALYTRILIPGGRLALKVELGTEQQSLKRLKMCGFLSVCPSEIPGFIYGESPMYKIGTCEEISLLGVEEKKNVISAWKLDNDNSETIAEDDLLEPEDLNTPASSSLRVCATTKKAKACKNCSCGLAEELETNKLKNVPTPPPDTSSAKSSCGSCYLGDAFRCASCPYLGMPAFKPGEKVQLAGNLLKDDL